MVALVWRLMLSTEGGLINDALGAVGLPGVSWLTSTTWVMPSIATIVAWKFIGFYVLLYLGGLQAIPRSLYEAAAVDGATGLQQLRWITVPQLRPVTFVVVVLSTLTASQLFTEPYLMTGGGPLNASMTPTLHLYLRGFRGLEFGYAAAMGLVLALLTMGTILVVRRVLDRE